MVWHIFRKDWKLLWHMTAGVLLLYVLKLVAESGSQDRRAHVELASLAATLAMAGLGLLVVILVQKDAVPGVRQDWLVRPVRRRDLMLAKIAFVVLAIQLPIFIADFIDGLAIGFPASLALKAACAQDFQLFLGISLPLLAFATLTSNLMEALAGSIAIALSVIVFNLSSVPGSFTWSGGISWIPATILWSLVVLGAIVIAALQYYRRKTLQARVVCAVTVVSALSIQFIPWSSAFAIQQSLSPEPDAARAVQIRFATGDRKPAIVSQDGLLANVQLPLDITGVGRDETLVNDRTESRIRERDGSTRPLVTNLYGSYSLRYNDRFSPLAVARETIEAGTARIEIDYYLTLLRLTSQQSMPPNATKLLDGIGICTTSTEPGYATPTVYCREGATPALMRWSLEGTPVSDLNWPGDYSPLPGSGLTNREMRFNIPGTFDGVNWRKGPGEFKISRVVMKAYQPIAHFKRHLSIPVSQLTP